MENVKNADEYIEIYGERLTNPLFVVFEGAVREIIGALMAEMAVIVHSRGVKTAEGEVAVVLELNSKWNAIRSRMRKLNPPYELTWSGFGIAVADSLPKEVLASPDYKRLARIYNSR